MKLEVGMYARLYRRSTDETIIVKVKDLNDKGCYNGLWVKTIKASFNIIDLIEIGDYVNGLPVDDIIFNDGVYIRIKDDKSFDTETRKFTNDYEDYIRKEDIKSVVTKEQFKSCGFAVER